MFAHMVCFKAVKPDTCFFFICFLASTFLCRTLAIVLLESATNCNGSFQLESVAYPGCNVSKLGTWPRFILINERVAIHFPGWLI